MLPLHFRKGIKMAKSTKYEVLKPIVMNNKIYKIGETITGLNADQETRLKELGAIQGNETPTPDPKAE